MYELTCPQCESRETAGFMRHGAVVDCGHCQHRYRIKPAHLRTYTPESNPDDYPDDELLTGLADIAALKKTERERLDKDGNVIGLSGLSNLMKQEQELAAQRRAATAAAAAPPLKPKATAEATSTPDASGHGGAKARPAAPASPNKRPKTLHYLLGGVGVAAALGGAAFVIMSGDAEPPGTTPPPTNTTTADPLAEGPTETPATDPLTADPGPDMTDPTIADPIYTPDPPGSVATVETVELDPDIPAVEGRTLTVSAWEIPETPRVLLTPPAPDQRIRLISPQHVITFDGASQLTATVSSTIQPLIAEADLYISLVDQRGHEHAVIRQPISLLDNASPTRLSIAMPEGLWQEDFQVVTDAVVHRTFDEVVLLRDIIVETLGRGPTTVQRITTFNPFDAKLPGAIFRLTARDYNGEVVSRVTYDWDQTIEPIGKVEFYLPTPLPDEAADAEWTADGVVYGMD